MLVEKIKEVCIANTLNFNHGSPDWQNLKDYPQDAALPFEQRNKYVLLLWNDRQFKFNSYGATIGYIFTGELLLVVRSKISDKDYNYKYETHIKNLKSESEDMLEDFTICDEWRATNWKEIEVENVYDTNLDGVKIQFTLTFEE